MPLLGSTFSRHPRLAKFWRDLIHRPRDYVFFWRT